MGPRRDTKRMRGFTITETVVVIAITTTVMAMVLPTMNRAREQARTVQGMANLQQVGQALQVFTIDNSNTLPVGYWRGSNAPPPNPGDDFPTGALETDWMVMLNDFLAGGGDTYEGLANGERNGEMLKIFKDPNAEYPDEGIHHYTGHPLLLPDVDVINDPAHPEVVRYRLTRFRRPHEVVLVMDGIQVPNNQASFANAFAMDGNSLDPENGSYKPFFNANESGNPTNDNDNDAVIAPGHNYDPYDTAAMGGAAKREFADIRWRQNGNTAANFIFPDGHSETKRMGDLKKRNIRIDY